jgi:thiamine biosynthesis lipoprotein
VTVLASDAALADAAATALFVAGPQQWPDVARHMGIHEVLLIDTAGGAHMSDTLEPLVHFERPPVSSEMVTLEAPSQP